ncbi:hypothetical protein DOY81_001121 [Sarcophaga bullata]|nr:hypothetical protein DOY81_001121 [Sarcophaga bullata]
MIIIIIMINNNNNDNNNDDDNEVYECTISNINTTRAKIKQQKNKSYYFDDS